MQLHHLQGKMDVLFERVYLAPLFLQALLTWVGAQAFPNFKHPNHNLLKVPKVQNTPHKQVPTPNRYHLQHSDRDRYHLHHSGLTSSQYAPSSNSAV